MATVSKTVSPGRNRNIQTFRQTFHLRPKVPKSVKIPNTYNRPQNKRIPNTDVNFKYVEWIQ